jgi:peptidoglycan-N-acetylglucosamine deacetylase
MESVNDLRAQRGMRFISLALALVVFAPSARAEIVTRLPTDEKVVALTFDACKAGNMDVQIDKGITDYLIANEIPFTVFMGGKFARDNPDEVRALAAHDFVEIENHSWAHNNHMTRLSDEAIVKDVRQAEVMIAGIAGRHTRFFRFPAGDADARTVSLLESLGYTVVHWRYPSGDPDKGQSANALVDGALSRTQAGDVLIFHVNGRGWNTAAAIPRIVEGLREKGFRFVLLRDYLPAPAIPPG